jgi:hypothetical protein
LDEFPGIVIEKDDKSEVWEPQKKKTKKVENFFSNVFVGCLDFWKFRCVQRRKEYLVEEGARQIP